MLIDPRSVANTILGIAEEFDLPVSNLSLQKIVYFVQGRHIAEKGIPLIQGEFEAWRYGPVHPLLYDSFKRAGSDPIDFRAAAFDYKIGKAIKIEEIADKRLRLFVRETAAAYLQMSPGRLVDLSHAKNSPWDIVTKYPAERVYGARIPNDLIRENFKFHKTTIHGQPKAGEPNEETPPSRN